MINFDGGGDSDFPAEEISFMCNCSPADDAMNIDCDLPESNTDDLCKKWQNYAEQCLGGDTGCNVDPSNMSETGWGYLMKDHPHLYEETIGNTLFCTKEEDLDCVISLEEFEKKHNTTFSAYEKKQIREELEGDCSEEAIFNYFEHFYIIVEDLDGGKIDLLQKIIDCFGPAFSEEEHIDCSSTTISSFGFVLYVDQPRTFWAGNPINAPWGGSIIDKTKLDIGHTFIEFGFTTQNNEQKSIVCGKYPDGSGVSPSSPKTISKINDDSEHDYTQYIAWSISCDDFNKVINKIKDIEGNDYDLNSSNCTNFALEVANHIGLDIPVTIENWGIAKHSGGGANPGSLGNDIINFPVPANGVKELNSGKANASDCN